MFVCKLVPAGMRCGTFPANTRHSCDMCSVGPTSSTVVRRGTGVVRFLLFLVGWPGVVLMFALFETSAPYFIYACVPTSGHTMIRYWPGPVLVLVLCLRLWPGTGPRLDRYIELLCVAAERTCGQSIWSFSQKM